MTARPLAPVIPSSAVPAGRHRARAAEGRPLPLACPVPAPPAPEDVVTGSAASTPPAGSPTGPSPARWAGAAATG